MEDFITQILNDVTELTAEQVNNLDSNVYEKLQNTIAYQLDEKLIDNIYGDLDSPINPTYIDISWVGYFNKNSKLYTLLLNHYGDKETMKKYIKGCLESQTRILFVYEYTANTGNNILTQLFNPIFKQSEDQKND